MKKTLSATATVEIHAGASAVWRGLTNPALVKRYFFGTQIESDWKVGGKIVFRGSWEGKAYEDKGTILAIEPDRLLRFDYWSNLSGTADIPENYVTVSYELEQRGGRTSLTVTQGGAESAEAKETSEQNWRSILEGLKKVVEEEEARKP